MVIHFHGESLMAVTTGDCDSVVLCVDQHVFEFVFAASLALAWQVDLILVIGFEFVCVENLSGKIKTHLSNHEN